MAALEKIVRPFVLLDSRAQEVLGTPVETDLGALDPAVLSWGGDTVGATEATVKILDLSSGYGLNGIIILPSENETSLDDQVEDEEEAEQAEDELLYNETSRQTSTVRISNPDDANQYVDVARIEEITFVGPDGQYRRFVFHNPPEGVVL